MIYPFALDFSRGANAAVFPFMFDGAAFTRFRDSSPAPRCALSARAAGDMRFTAGEKSAVRGRFFLSLGIDPARVYSLEQVHSRDVYAAGPGFPVKGDGMVSFTADCALCVTVADCLPVFLLDTVSGAAAALHSGWKGTGIVLRALDLMAERGVKAENVAAALGPCIRSCCYNVDKERAALFESEFGGESVRESGGEWYLDMQAANIGLLEKAGVRNIACCKDCTFTDERLGSYRREGADRGSGGGSYTRMAALVGYIKQDDIFTCI